jgi:hypothetical protein
MSAPTRECLGCEGRGLEVAEVQVLSMLPFFPCPVCAGSGQVEAKPSVRDAVADAETLRLYHDFESASPECSTESYNRLALRKQPIPCCHLRDALAWASVGALAVSLGHADGSAHKESARAAFRAVPGLRGE